MSRRKKDEEGGGMDTTLWMLTFSDLLQLLLTFFVLLISMSSLDVKSIKKMFSLFPGAIGPLQLTDIGPITEVYIKPSIVKKPISQEVIKRLMEKQYETEVSQKTMGLISELGIKKERRGIVITFPSSFLFKSGSAEINPLSYPALDRLLELLKLTRNDLEILGHTDNVPISTKKIASNWELSLARSISVAEFYSSRGIDARRMTPIGGGEYHPLFPNDTAEHRESNRRVEIIIVQEKR